MKWGWKSGFGSRGLEVGWGVCWDFAGNCIYLQLYGKCRAYQQVAQDGGFA